jgi:hypothetical protein
MLWKGRWERCVVGVLSKPGGGAGFIEGRAFRGGTPELKKGSAANGLEVFVASTVEPDSVRFKDKTREKQQVNEGRGEG